MMINSTKMTGVKKGIIKKFSLKKSKKLLFFDIHCAFIHFCICENTQQELEAGYFPDASLQHNNSPEHCMFAA